MENVDAWWWFQSEECHEVRRDLVVHPYPRNRSRRSTVQEGRQPDEEHADAIDGQMTAR